MRHLLVACLLATAVLAQQPPVSTPQLTVKAIFAPGGLTGPAPQDIRFSPDGTKISYILRDDTGEHGQLWCVDVASGKKAVLVPEGKLANLAPSFDRLSEREKERRTRYSVAQYYWAPDSSHILFDALGQFWLYRLDTGTAVQITASPERASDPRFSPDGSRVAFVRKHNLFVADREGTGLRQLTHDADDDILNGEVDWVYAEELDVRHNYFWSPDSRQILFLQMYESAVPTYPIADLIPIQPTVDFQKYPKAGDPNPQVRLGVVNANGGKVRWLRVPADSGDKQPGPPQLRESYIPRFGWLRPGIAWVEVLNRAQDRRDLYFVAVDGNARLVLSERSPTWVEVDDNFTVIGTDRFLWTSWRDGHTHLYFYSFNGTDPTAGEAKLEAQLTQGAFEVFDVTYVDEAGKLVYFTANAADDRQRRLFCVHFDGSGFEQVSREPGTHEPTFDGRGKWYIDKFSAIMSPPRLSLCRVGGDGACNGFWESRSLAAYNLAAPQFVDFHADDGTVLHGSLIMPPNVPAGTKIPLVLYPYGGPGAQQVRDVWGGNCFLFNQMLAQKGIAVLSVDNRGSAGRGRAFAGVARGELGKIEIQDQLSALSQALDRHPALDKDRIGFWGWSYGGTMTLWALTRTTAFKAGVAVAPVTDWRDYDSIYTERYLSLPQLNAEGYRRSSPVSTAADLHGDLLLVQGTGDDNVHLQNTAQMTEAFINAGKRFQLMLYPRKLHSIAGTAAQTDLFTRIEEHFERELLGRPQAGN